jgi:hypothetical protein
MAYSADTFVADEQPTTAKWNKLWSNDASFNDGTGIGDNAILNRHITTGNLYSSKFYNPYKWSAYRSAALSPVTDVTIPFEVELFDTSNNYSTSTGLFTAPIAGFYWIQGSLFNAASSTYYITQINKNGSLFRYFPGTNLTSSPAMSGGSDILLLAANDTVGLAAHSSATVALNPGVTNCYFNGFLISAT